MVARVWVDGIEGAGVPGDDPGLTLGLTAFETLRTYGRRAFRLGAHVERLVASAAMMGVPCPSACEVEVDILDAIDITAIEDVQVRYTLTGGGRRVLEIKPLDLSRIGRPLRLASCVAEPWVALPGWVKHGSRAAWTLEAQRRRVEEVLLIDRAGWMLETSRSNVIAVFGERLVVPPDDGRRLKGVTLGAVIEAAEGAGVAVERRGVGLGEGWDALWVCSTLKELAPVVELDGRGVEQRGEALRRAVGEAFVGLVKGECGSAGRRPDPLQGAALL